MLDAARVEFAERGFSGATLRSIAARAGADPAMVNYWFGSKQELFAAALELPIDLPRLRADIADGPRHQIGARLVSAYLGVWDKHPTQMAAMVRDSISSDRGATVLREFLAHALLGPLVDALGVDQSELRSGLAATQMIGLSVARFALRLDAVVDADPALLVMTIGPTVQRYLADELFAADDPPTDGG